MSQHVAKLKILSLVSLKFSIFINFLIESDNNSAASRKRLSRARHRLEIFRNCKTQFLLLSWLGEIQAWGTPSTASNTQQNSLRQHMHRFVGGSLTRLLSYSATINFVPNFSGQVPRAHSPPSSSVSQQQKQIHSLTIVLFEDSNRSRWPARIRSKAPVWPDRCRMRSLFPATPHPTWRTPRSKHHPEFRPFRWGPEHLVRWNARATLRDSFLVAPLDPIQSPPADNPSVD